MERVPGLRNVMMFPLGAVTRSMPLQRSLNGPSESSKGLSLGYRVTEGQLRADTPKMGLTTFPYPTLTNSYM